MTLTFKFATHSNGLLGRPRGYVIIEGLKEGQELTAEEAFIVLLDRIDSTLERIEDKVE